MEPLVEIAHHRQFEAPGFPGLQLAGHVGKHPPEVGAGKALKQLDAQRLGGWPSSCLEQGLIDAFTPPVDFRPLEGRAFQARKGQGGGLAVNRAKHPIDGRGLHGESMALGQGCIGGAHRVLEPDQGAHGIQQQTCRRAGAGCHDDHCRAALPSQPAATLAWWVLPGMRER